MLVDLVCVCHVKEFGYRKQSAGHANLWRVEKVLKIHRESKMHLTNKHDFVCGCSKIPYLLEQCNLAVTVHE